MWIFLRPLIKISAGIIAGLAMLFIAAFFILKTSVSDYNQQLNISGLDDNIDIVRDRYAIPHIYAKTVGDAYFGLGFAHAQDRLWQLELTRAAGQGRLSEIFGEGTLAVDKLTRTVNSAKVAELSLQRLDQQTKNYFQRYIDGINSYINNRSGVLPPEFLLFSVEPTPWTIEDSSAFLALVALGADNWHKELQRASMQQYLTTQQINTLFPNYPSNGPVTNGDFSSRSAKATTLNEQVSSDIEILAEGYSIPNLRSLTNLSKNPLVEAYPASNTWVIHGSKTKSNKPLLASDPHGPISAPADYYLAKLSGPDFDITGIGYVGMPVFAVGHNRHIAWGITDIIADLSDLYAEKIVAGKTGYYETTEGEKPFIYRKEVIKVKDQDDVVINIRNTEHGPVISDVVNEAETISQRLGDHIVLALSQITFSQGNTSGQAFMRINHAQNWQQFKQAMNDYELAHNLSYADTEGNIGMISSAVVPMRKSGDGFMISPGWNGKHDITGYLNKEEMPFSLNPEQGFLVNANNKPEPWDFPYFISRENILPYRANRIIEGIGDSSQHTVNSMIDIQTDVTSLAAKQLLPIFLTTKTDDESDARAIALLSKWDGSMQKNRAEPLIYMTWERELGRLLYQDELKDSFSDYFASHPTVIADQLQPNSPWCDNIQTTEIELCSELLTKSLHQALQQLSNQYGGDMDKWKWGDSHKAVFKHEIFTYIPLLNMLSDIKLSNNGGPHTVNQAKSDYNSIRPFDQNYGPRYRQIIDLADMSNSRYMIAPGVSGNLLSPYYSHLAKLWRDNQYIQFAADKHTLLKSSIATTQLKKHTQ